VEQSWRKQAVKVLRTRVNVLHTGQHQTARHVRFHGAMDEELPTGVVRRVCVRASLPVEMLDTLAPVGRFVERALLPLVLLLLALPSTARNSKVECCAG
jgi:hypothetical protein